MSFNPIVREEYAGKFHGIDGRFHAVTVKHDSKPGTVFNQKFVASKAIANGRTIHLEIRFDDSCNNGHNSFSITGHIINPAIRGRDKWEMCGCIHDELCAAWAELKPLIKWHLTSSDSPMHYVANTLYHASDCDYRGKRWGEPYAWDSAVQFGDNPIKHKVKDSFAKFLQDASQTSLEGERFDFQVIEYTHKIGESYYRKYTYGGYADKWHECPFDTEEAALDFLHALKHCKPQFVKTPTLFSEGKERNFDAARASGVWPEATDEQLSLPRDELKALLEARLPALQSEFRAMIEQGGFIFERESGE